MNAAQNPFRFDRITTLAFTPRNVGWPELWAKLEAQDGRGAIVGPHGSGKTTLLGEVARRMETRGLRVTRLFFNDRARDLPADFRAAQFGANDALIVDGPEHLRAWQRPRLWRARPAVFVITAHRRTPLPTWTETSTSPDLLRELCARLGQPIGPEQAERLWRAHGGDVRAALWQLYDEAARG